MARAHRADARARFAVAAGAFVLSAILLAPAASAQQQLRRATNIAALKAHPNFYHLRPIVVVGKVTATNNGDVVISDEAGGIRLVYKGGWPDGLVEVRGEFWDVGRMNPDDPRFSGYDMQRTFHVDPQGAWPRAGQVTAIVASTIAETSAPTSPTIRAMVLSPARYLDQKVTVIGQFGGRNLLGDLPEAPAKSRYDFVVRSADAAIWVTNLRPRGKDFELALDARLDTGRWVEVSGTLQQGRGLQWLDGTGATIRIVKPPAPDATTTQESAVRVPAAPAPEVVFSAPTQDETDVQLTTSVRIQFSRDISPGTFKGHVRVKYDDEETKLRGEPDTPIIEFTTQYLPANRVLEIKFQAPLDRFRAVHIELLDGILGTDQQKLPPWKLDFQTGG
jgi:hypothetical protein